LTRLAIIGLGPLGASIGLGLKQAKASDLSIVAAGGDKEALSQGSKMGAVDKVVGTIKDAVVDADVVVMDATHQHTRDLLEAVGPQMRPNAILTDTGAMKMRMMEWTKRYLPESVSYVGGHPLPKDPISQVKDARADLLAGTDYCIIQSATAKPGAVSTVVGIAEAVGARPFFLDASEHDAFASAVSFLPVVLSAALTTSVSSSKSWREMSKLASGELKGMTRLASQDPEANQLACLASPETLVHWVDQMIAELYAYRKEIQQNDDALLKRFIQGWEAIARWEAGALGDEPGPRPPSMTDSMAATFMGDLLLKKYREMTGRDRKQWEYFKKS
jgi:prephenate dehydrogenase